MRSVMCRSNITRPSAAGGLHDKRVGRYWRGWAEKHPELLARVLEEVRENGR